MTHGLWNNRHITGYYDPLYVPNNHVFFSLLKVPMDIFSAEIGGLLPSKRTFSHLKMDGWNLEYDPFLLGHGLFSEANC